MAVMSEGRRRGESSSLKLKIDFSAPHSISRPFLLSFSTGQREKDGRGEGWDRIRRDKSSSPVVIHSRPSASQGSPRVRFQRTSPDLGAPNLQSRPSTHATSTESPLHSFQPTHLHRQWAEQQSRTAEQHAAPTASHELRGVRSGVSVTGALPPPPPPSEQAKTYVSRDQVPEALAATLDQILGQVGYPSKSMSHDPALPPLPQCSHVTSPLL